jgi:hypothetical protein
MLTLAALCGYAQTNIYIPQIADGGGWQTTIVVTTMTPAGAVVTSNCFQDGSGGSTAPWVPVQRVANLNAAVGTLYLKSPGTADLVTTGWCQLSSPSGSFQAYAIFTQRVSGKQDQDGTAIGAPAASRFLVPYDSTDGAAVGIAIANVGNVAETVTFSLLTTQQTTLTTTVGLQGFGHLVFALGDPTGPLGSNFASTIAGTSGTIEVISNKADLSVLTLRFNKTQSFTAAPVYAAAGTPVLGPAAATSAPPFSTLFVTGSCACALDKSVVPVVAAITPDPMGGTYSASLVGLGLPLFVVNFAKGSLSGQTLKFSVVSSGIYGTQTVMGDSMTLSVTDFGQVGSATSGSVALTIPSSTGSPNTINATVTGTATYIR